MAKGKMFNSRLTRSGPEIEGLKGLKRYNLRELKQLTQSLGQRLKAGDWSVVSEICDIHLFVCGMLGKGLAYRYRQDPDEMVAWAFLGIVDGCSKVFHNINEPINLTGFLIACAKGMCLNNCIDSATGYKKAEIMMMIKNNWPRLQRQPVTDDVCEEDLGLVKVDFLDTFLPMLSDEALSVFELAASCYSDDEIMDNLNMKKTKFHNCKGEIERRFDTYMAQNYGRYSE